MSARRLGDGRSFKMKNQKLKARNVKKTAKEAKIFGRETGRGRLNLSLGSFSQSLRVNTFVLRVSFLVLMSLYYMLKWRQWR